MSIMVYHEENASYPGEVTPIVFKRHKSTEKRNTFRKTILLQTKDCSKISKAETELEENGVTPE